MCVCVKPGKKANPIHHSCSKHTQEGNWLQSLYVTMNSVIQELPLHDQSVAIQKVIAVCGPPPEVRILYINLEVKTLISTIGAANICLKWLMHSSAHVYSWFAYAQKTLNQHSYIHLESTLRCWKLMFTIQCYRLALVMCHAFQLLLENVSINWYTFFWSMHVDPPTTDKHNGRGTAYSIIPYMCYWWTIKLPSCTVSCSCSERKTPWW